MDSLREARLLAVLQKILETHASHKKKDIE